MSYNNLSSSAWGGEGDVKPCTNSTEKLTGSLAIDKQNLEDKNTFHTNMFYNKKMNKTNNAEKNIISNVSNKTVFIVTTGSHLYILVLTISWYIDITPWGYLL